MDELTAETQGGGPSRRGFFGLLAGGAAVGVPAGYAISRGTQITNPAIIDTRMTIYFATSGEIYALYASTGAVRWASPLITSGSIAAGSGGVYVADYDGLLHSLDAATGTIKWSHRLTNNIGSPFLSVSAGSVYITPGDGYTYALEAATGYLRWRRRTTSGTFGQSPVVYRGMVYVGSPDSYVFALDAATGEFRWKFGKGNQVSPDSSTGALALVQSMLFAEGTDNLYVLGPRNGVVQGVYPPLLPCSNGVAYVGSDNGSIQAREVTKSRVLWTRQVNDAGWFPPSVANGILYLGVTNVPGSTSWVGAIMAFDAATGRHVWTYLAPEGNFSIPLIVAGSVYVVGNWNIYALNAATGKARWVYPTSQEKIVRNLVISSP